MVVSGSGKTVWWRCEKGHEWKARIVDRANGRGCAKCMGKQAHIQHNLALKFPELVTEWHPSRNGKLTPCLVTPRSNKKVWWQCSRGHEWESTISNRTKGQNCPVCKPSTSLQEIRLFCELKAIFGQVLWRNRVHGVECDVFIPKYSTAVEYDGAFWHERRSTQDQLKNHKLAGMGIRIFRVRSHGLKKLSEGDILLSLKQTTNPDINVVKVLLRTMRQTLPLDEPDKEMVLGYLAREEFVNSKEFKQIISCLPGPPIEKSLATQVPELAKQWHFGKNAPLTPQMFHAGSGKKVWWICDNGHEWKASILNRARGSGCPYCAGQRALPENNFAIKFPELAKEWHPSKNGDVSPDMLTPKSHQKIWWLCESGHEWQASVNGRARGSGCPYWYWKESLCR